MELKSTIAPMISKDYKERFIAEFYQLKIRYDRLKDMCDKWDENRLYFIPTCSREIYDRQLKCMREYMDTLEERAKIENIPLILSEDDTEYKEVIDKCLREYREKQLDWVNWEYFKEYLKERLFKECGVIIDLRSVLGRRILSYAKENWSKIW